MNPIRQALERAAAAGLVPSGSSILLAVSGGADSMALLYGVADAAPDLDWKLSVGHVHHGWRGREADRDLGFVEEHARRLGLPFASRRRDARAASREFRLSPEAGARLVRYAALSEIAKELGASRIATAHQEDDLLESHLLAKRRRGGIASLAGPRGVRDDGVVRPLLSVSRTDILGFLSERGIPFRRDATNGDLRLARNRIRRDLAAMTSSDRAAMLDVIQRLRAERDALDRELEHLLPSDASSIDADALARLPEPVRRAAVERLAAPLARPGRPPMTGREREQVLVLIASGRDFRFEAGRRIRFQRRGSELRVSLRAVYDSQIDIRDSRAGGAA